MAKTQNVSRRSGKYQTILQLPNFLKALYRQFRVFRFCLFEFFRIFRISRISRVSQIFEFFEFFDFFFIFRVSRFLLDLEVSRLSMFLVF